jgi:hypothetical protein
MITVLIRDTTLIKEEDIESKQKETLRGEEDKKNMLSSKNTGEFNVDTANLKKTTVKHVINKNQLT